MENVMTRRRIEQYARLQREIAMLEASIQSAETKGAFVSDYAKDYTTGHPRVITLQGYGSRAVPRLLQKKAQYIAECDAVERFIESIDDSITRQLLTRRFIEDKSLKETAKIVGYSDKYTSKLINAFFENMIPDHT